jgi:hypothetical protein
LPLVAPSISLAGQPSRFGGIAARVMGWGVLVLGFVFALTVLLLLQSFWPGSLLGWAFGVPIAVASLCFGLLLIFGGRKLQRHGQEKQRGVKLEAIRGLLAHRGGAVTVREAAGALSVSETDADALLTELARDSASDVRIDVDDDGQLRYDFSGVAAFRVLEENSKSRVVIDAEGEAAEADLEARVGRTRVRP